MLVFILMILGILSRLVVHAPNFTPVVAIALFGAAYLDRKYAVLLPVLMMMASDFVLGLHQVILFTWGALVVVAFLGLQLRKNKTIGSGLGFSLLGAVVFFVISNFGAWLVMYPRTLEGFVTCYVAAIPFFRSTLLSTVAYTVALIGGYELLAARLRSTKLAAVLLP